jgi:hypothetical protein
MAIVGFENRLAQTSAMFLPKPASNASLPFLRNTFVCSKPQSLLSKRLPNAFVKLCNMIMEKSFTKPYSRF